VCGCTCAHTCRQTCAGACRFASAHLRVARAAHAGVRGVLIARAVCACADTRIHAHVQTRAQVRVGLKARVYALPRLRMPALSRGVFLVCLRVRVHVHMCIRVCGWSCRRARVRRPGCVQPRWTALARVACSSHVQMPLSAALGSARTFARAYAPAPAGGRASRPARPTYNTCTCCACPYSKRRPWRQAHLRTPPCSCTRTAAAPRLAPCALYT